MQRIVISVDGSISNIGTPTVSTIAGRITMVQFSLACTTQSETGFVQVAVTPNLVGPIQDSGLNPPEIAQAYYAAELSAASPGSMQQSIMVPADFPLTPGIQLFVNSQGVTVQGNIVLFVS